MLNTKLVIAFGLLLLELAFYFYQLTSWFTYLTFDLKHFVQELLVLGVGPIVGLSGYMAPVSCWRNLRLEIAFWLGQGGVIYIFLGLLKLILADDETYYTALTFPYNFLFYPFLPLLILWWTPRGWQRKVDGKREYVSMKGQVRLVS